MEIRSFMKLNGGALFYALIISMVIATVTCSVLLVGYYARLSLMNDSTTEEVFRNATSGTFLACNLTSSETDLGEEYDLFNRGKDSVFIHKRPWGAFDVTYSKAHRSNFSAQQIALVGSGSNSENAFALWLADMDRPLSITGSTALRGKCFLPVAGVERAYIEGSSYSGKQLVYGASVPADRFLPKYNEERVSAIAVRFDGASKELDSLVGWNEFILHDSILQSFERNALLVAEKVPLRIKNQFVHGQVCIVSSISIYVEKTASLENVILFAPIIEIEAGTEGQFQAFASDSLIVGKATHLQFPSVLALVPNKHSPEFTELVVGENCRIMGDVFAADQYADFRRHVSISVGAGSLIYGAVYSSESVDLKATVFGSVSCAKFVLRTNSAVYENHLMNAVIDRAKRKDSYVSSLLFSDPLAPKSIALWLH